MPSQEELMRQMTEAYGIGEVKEEPADKNEIQVVFQTGHTSAVSAVAVSADGRSLISGGQDGVTRVWDIASGQETRAVTSSGIGWPKQVGFSPDASQFFVTTEMGATVYDRSSGASVTTGSTSLITRDGRARVSLDRKRASMIPTIIDSATGAVLWKVPGSEIVQPIALSADGTRLLDIESRVWRKDARQPVVIQRELLTAGFTSLALSPTGRWLAIENLQRQVELYDTNTGARVRTLAAERSMFPTHTILFSPDEQQLAYATADGNATLWRVADGTQLTTLSASAVNFSDDGKTLVLGGARGGAPWLHDVASGTETRLSADAAQVTDVAVTDRDRALLVTGSDGKVRLWSLATAEVTRVFDCPHDIGAWRVAAHPTLPLFALGCTDGSVALWNRETGQRVSQLPFTPPTESKPAFAIASFSTDGRLLVAASREQVMAWNVSSSAVVTRFDLPPASPPPQLMETVADVSAEVLAGATQVRALAVDPAGRSIAIGRTFDVLLLDVATGRVIRKMGGIEPAASDDTPDFPISARDARSARIRPGAVARATPHDITDELMSENRGAGHLAFSPDGRRLFGDGATWDVATGHEIIPAAPESYDMRDISAVIKSMGERARRSGETGPVAVSSDGKWLARSAGRVIRIIDNASGLEVRELKGHRGTVEMMKFAANGRRLYSGASDGAVRVWSLDDGRQIVALTSLGAQDFVAVTPDQFYRISKARLSGVAFRQGDTLFPFEQFDLRFNRPDIVMERLGTASPAVVASYRQSWLRRVKKLGFTEDSLRAEMSLPVVTLDSSAVPVTTHAKTLTLAVHAEDPNASLDRLNVLVNDVPVYGTRGLAIDNRSKQVNQRIEVPLARGRNRVQVSVLNANGVESLRQTVYTTSEAQREPPDVWVVAIGVSKYQRTQYNLRYAAKDAADIAAAYRASGSRTHVLTLADSEATRQGIESARRWLEQAKTDDLVVVFAAGHGMTDQQQNYYFGTYDIDPENPGKAGLPFESFESLLDGIAPLRKLLLVDTCFSGEIEKDDAVTPVANVASTAAGAVVMRSFKQARAVNVVADDSTSAPTATGAAAADGPASDGAAVSGTAALSGAALQIQRDLFADLRRGTGAVVISSASGNEFAFEGAQWNNGVFTYALLDGIRERAADANQDGEVTVGELQTWVTRQVVELTHGGQNPTVRRENLAYDFAVF